MYKVTLITTLFLIFLFSTSACSLGIGPSGPVNMPDVNFEPGLRIDRDIFVTNSESYPFPVEMDIWGNLSEYATLSEYQFTLAPAGEPGSSRSLKFAMTLPEDFEPGSHIIAIRATQLLEDGSGTPGYLGARVRVGIGFYVHIPYPGKYVKADMRIENAEVNQTILFIINAINRGNETIENAQGTIKIYDVYGKYVTALKTDTKSINPDQTVELIAEWPAFGIRPGEYGAAVDIEYDGAKTTLQKDFRIGSPTAEILNVTAQTIVNGTVGAIKTTVMSYWSNDIENAYVSVTAIKGDYLGTSASQSITLKPWEKTNFINYWDTSDAPGPGEYRGIVTLHYLNKTDTMEFTIKVVEQPFVFPDLMWIIVIVLIIIFAVMVFFALRKRKDKFKQKKLF